MNHESLLLIIAVPVVLLLIMHGFLKLDTKLRAREGLKPIEPILSEEKIRILLAILFTIIIPAFCFYLQGDFNRNLPFSKKHLPTIITLSYVSCVCYWISRLRQNKLSPITQVIVMAGLLQGCFLCIFISIHLLPAMLGAIFFPYFFIPVWTPLICLRLFYKELQQIHQRTLDKFRQYPLGTYRRFQRFHLQILLHPFWKSYPLAALIMLPLFLIQEAILILFGQAPDAVVRAFIESCNFAFSNPDYCPPAPNHYLCTVATHGNPQLVKPVRYGVRRGGRILVTRQLLIANAFEQWLEEHAPNFARRLRRFYDRLDIPVERWARSRRRANIIYFLMKPLEWFFLLWLYTFDHKPETRIARQYLPSVPPHHHSINSPKPEMQ